MKTIATITVDGEIKKRAMEIIQRDMHSTLSCEINKFLNKLVKNKVKNGKSD